MKKALLVFVLLFVFLIAFSACNSAQEPSSDKNTGDKTHPCEHTFGEWVAEKEVSCKNEGLLVRFCDKCDAREEQSVPKLKTHTPVPVAAVPATCKDTGLTEGIYCSLCGEIFLAQEKIPITDDHTPVTVAAVPATCKDTGLTEGISCSICNKVFVAQESIPKTNVHNYISTKIRATKTSQGYFLHQCDVCTDSYKDGYYDYAGTESLIYANNRNDGTCWISGISDPKETCIDIPEKSPDGYTVIGIKAHAFQYNTAITSLIAPETVTFIGERAFDGCYNLLTAYIPGVFSMEANAFDCCSALKSVVYSDRLTTIPSKTFYGCRALKECRAVSSNKNLDTVTMFGYYAFAMSGITNPTFSADLTPISLANQPFFSCSSLGRIDLSAATLTTINGFSNSSFTEFVFPQGITTIPRSCFASCYFETMTIPDSVTTIETSAFLYAGFTKVTLGSGVATIGAYAFDHTNGEIDITTAVSLESVGYRAFANSTLTSIILPASVRSIGGEAFGECSSLKILGIPFVSTSPEPSNISTNCFGAIFKADVDCFDQDDYIPSSLKTVIITSENAEIEYGDFMNMTLSILVLPKEFTCAEDALDFSLTAIYYSGSPNDLPDISKAIGRVPPNIYYYSENKPEVSGKYWHYVNGVPASWQ